MSAKVTEMINHAERELRKLRAFLRDWGGSSTSKKDLFNALETQERYIDWLLRWEQDLRIEKDEQDDKQENIEIDTRAPTD